MAQEYTEYIVVSGDTVESLVAQVNVKLTAGYELVGGIVMSLFSAPHTSTYMQAMGK